MRYKAKNILTDLEIVGTKEELAEITGIATGNVATYATKGILYDRKWKFYHHYADVEVVPKNYMYDVTVLEEWDRVRIIARKALLKKAKSRKRSDFRTPYNRG